MITLPDDSKIVFDTRHDERGAALAIAILMMVLMSAVALGVLALVKGNSQIASSDLKRTEACYASAAALEIMTNNFGSLFAHTSRPTAAQLHEIELNPPTELTNPTDPNISPYTFPDHSLALNTAAQAAMGPNKTVTIPYGPYSGLLAGLTPYTLTATAQSSMAQCKLTRDMNNYLIPLFQFGMFSDKDIELHPGPDFTFNGRVHANGNIYLNGSVKFLEKVTTANELVYDVLRNGSTRTGAKVSMQVGSFDVKLDKGSVNNGPNLSSATSTPAGQRGYFPDSPNGTINTSWNTTSVAAPSGGNPKNTFGGQLLTRTTGAVALKLPLQIDNNPTRELIKRRMPNDSPDAANPTALTEARYHNKAEIRILIDDENPTTTDASGIPSGQGVSLSTFDPIPLPAGATDVSYTANGGGRALWKIKDNNTSVATSYDSAAPIIQQQQNGTARQADTVRGVKASKLITGATNANPIVITCVGHGYATGDTVVIAEVVGNTAANVTYTITSGDVLDANRFKLTGKTGNGTYAPNSGRVHRFSDIPKSPNGTVIPYGAGITGRILIQIVDAAGNEKDVTKEILSMGMTVGEPNAIIHLQRPLWAAFTQGSRDATVSGGTNNLMNILNNTRWGADGAIPTPAALSLANGYLNGIPTDAGVIRSDVPPTNALGTLLAFSTPSSWVSWNSIVPINVYNIREGHLKSSMTQDAVYERGITSIVEVNMKNLARWLDGVFDQNLLAGTSAVSANIGHPDGYIVYISDRRGDKVKSMVDSSGTTINSTNGMVDNLDIYGPNGTMDPGEDVQARGLATGASLVSAGLKDTTELPDPAVLVTSPSYGSDQTKRAIAVAAWQNLDSTRPTNHKFFRSAVRLFNGENLQVTSAAGRLTTTHGISVATENMVYIWGNYNTTGINQAPATGTASLNDPAAASRFTGAQVPASIVADAIIPISKTWYDAMSARYTDDYKDRPADAAIASGLPGVTSETAVRAGVIAGQNLAAMDGTPDADNGQDSRMNGGMHNFPHFMEDWDTGNRRWNFVGSFIPLYYSTQAMGQWYHTFGPNPVPYGAPIRNWAFDTTFLVMDRLPPGTPMFQYTAPTAFRQVL